MALQTGLQLVSKFRSDAALYESFAGKFRRHGPQRSDLGQLFGWDTLDGRLMRLDTVPDFDHGEFGWVIVGLIQRDGLAPLRRFDHWHGGEEKIAQRPG
jgi:hypothetical protein